MKAMNWAILPAAMMSALPTMAFAQQLSAPAEISLVDEGQAGPVFRESSSSLRLYTFDKDSAGRSTCTGACLSAWPPVSAPAGAKPVGDWAVVTREDGTFQWGYKGKPVYTRFHDQPSTTSGASIPGWHVLLYSKQP